MRPGASRVFYPAVAAALLWPQSALDLLTTRRAAGFLVCQASILQASKGIPSWRMPLMPWMLVATGLFEGLGLMAVVAALAVDIGQSRRALAPSRARCSSSSTPRCGGAIARRRRQSASARYRDAISRRSPRSCICSVTQLPGILLVASSPGRGVGAAMVLAACAGAAAIAGGVLWKFTVITRACHQQGYRAADDAAARLRPPRRPGAARSQFDSDAWKLGLSGRFEIIRAVNSCRRVCASSLRPRVAVPLTAPARSAPLQLRAWAPAWLPAWERPWALPA